MTSQPQRRRIAEIALQRRQSALYKELCTVLARQRKRGESEQDALAAALAALMEIGQARHLNFGDALVLGSGSERARKRTAILPIGERDETVSNPE